MKHSTKYHISDAFLIFLIGALLLVSCSTVMGG